MTHEHIHQRGTGPVSVRVDTAERVTHSVPKLDTTHRRDLDRWHVEQVDRPSRWSSRATCGPSGTLIIVVDFRRAGALAVVGG